MTANQFEGIWSSNYPLTPPIAYLLKEAYPERWFRIDSLPESKGYHEDESELDTILSRHNTLITDILGSHSEVLLVTGEYDSVSGDKASWQFSASDSLKHLPFTQLTPIPLDRLFG